MEALVMAGGKGSRMGYCGVEKPMIEVGGVFTVKRVIDALNASKNIDKLIRRFQGENFHFQDFT